MITIGFDQSTTKSGYAIFKNKHLEKSGVVELPKSMDAPLRIKTMFISLIDIVEQTRPDFLVVEANFYKQNIKTMLMLSQLQGMLIGYAYKNEIDVVSPLPSQWRSKLNFTQGKKGERDVEKQQAIMFIKDTFGVDASEDECEAIALTYAMLL